MPCLRGLDRVLSRPGRRVPVPEATVSACVLRSDPRGSSFLSHRYLRQGVSRYDGVGIGDAGEDVFLFEVRVVVHEFLVGGSLAQQAQDKLDGDSHVPDDRLAVEDVGPGR